MPVEEDVEFFESNDLSNYPCLLELEPQLSEDAYDNEFEDSLEDLINRIELAAHGRIGLAQLGAARTPDGGEPTVTGTRSTVCLPSREGWTMTSTDADADRTDGRDESVNERMDRNWNEILQELRVTQTGTQILTGFLLAIAFQPKFADLDRLPAGRLPGPGGRRGADHRARPGPGQPAPRTVPAARQGDGGADRPRHPPAARWSGWAWC